MNNLYEQVQSTPLLFENKSHNPLLYNQKDSLCSWTWKSLDNIVDKESKECSSRTYATRVDRNCTLYRKDVFYSGSVYNLKENPEEPNSNDWQSIPSHLNKKKFKKLQQTSTNSLEPNMDLKINEHEDKKSKLFKKMFDILSEMTNFSLFTDPLFLMYALSCTLTMFGKYQNVSCILYLLLNVYIHYLFLVALQITMMYQILSLYITLTLVYNYFIWYIYFLDKT